MTHDDMIAVITAHKNGAEIECRCSRFPDPWAKATKPCWDFDAYDYRIKPQPNLRPWKAGEVPVGAIIRGIGGAYPTVWMIIAASDTHALVPSLVPDTISHHISFSDLLDHYQHSTDGGISWKPCGFLE